MKTWQSRFSIPALLAISLGCVTTGGPGPGTGPWLGEISGGSRFAQDGRTGLNVIGGGTGPIHWRLVPAEAGTVEGVQARPAQTQAVPSQPQPPTFSNTVVRLNPGFILADAEAYAEVGGGVQVRRINLKAIQGIQVRLPQDHLNLAPGAEVWLTATVSHPTEAAAHLPSRVEWSWVNGDGGGWVREQEGYEFSSWLQSIAWKLKAPTAPGAYTLRATAAADPDASALLTLDVR